MSEGEMEAILAWAEVAGGYSLTRIYLRVRKLHGISRLDPNYRRYRPYLLSRHLPGTWLYGKQILGNRATALHFLQLLQRELGRTYLRSTWGEPGLPGHGREELGIIFLSLHQQAYGTREWTGASLTATLELMERHMEGSWLPGDLIEEDCYELGKTNYNKNIKFPRWVKEVFAYLYGEERQPCLHPLKAPEASGGEGDRQGH